MSQLRKRKRKSQLRQCELAAAAGLHLSTVNRLERGWARSTQQTASKLAQVLKYSVGDLFPGIELKDWER